MQRTSNLKLNSTQNRRKEINVMVKELVLTPLTCASIINEIVKCLVYQKSQIPYPYNWFKSVVNRKRKELQNQIQTKPTNFTVEQHYRVVSTAYDALEDLMKNLSVEFKNSSGDIQEVLILFGSTVYSPKETFRIRVMGLAKGHSEDNHLHVNTRNQHKVLRNIVLAQEWLGAMDTAIPPTNMYIMLQKRCRNNQDLEETFFQPNMQYKVPSGMTNTVINLDYNSNSEYNCCDNLSIFEDLPKEKIDVVNASKYENDNLNDANKNCVHDNPSCDLLWFQASIVLKGFKECFVNNVSATELW